MRPAGEIGSQRSSANALDVDDPPAGTRATQDPLVDGFGGSRRASILITSPDRDPQASESRPWLVAVIFLIPYVLLSVAWAVSNPPGAAPDEPDHLVKALGNSSFSLGAPGPGAPTDATPVQKRSASTTRVFEIPAALSPTAYACYAFDPTQTAACVPTSTGSAGEVVAVPSAVGDYPPFLYLPIGWVASLASTPEQAFVLGRLVVSFLSFGLLLLGAAHLTRWLGRNALVAYAVVLTPMAVYVCSSVSTSGIEFAAACAVSAVVAVALQRPDSLKRAATHWTVGVGGGMLALSRQLGVVTLGVLMLVLVFSVGWRQVWSSWKSNTVSFTTAVAMLVVSSVGVMWWELTYDHPSDLGPLFTGLGLRDFVDRFYGIVGTGIGVFGWLDTPLPDTAIAAWVVMWLVVIGAALLVARRSAFWSVLGMLVLTVVVTAVVYMSVFFPVAATVQGRHVLPLFVLCPIVASTTLVRHLGRSAGTTSRLLVTVGVVAGVVQGGSVYWNARRYAVGLDGPMLFLGHSEWSPPFGWVTWLAVALAGSILLVVALAVLAKQPKGLDGEPEPPSPVSGGQSGGPLPHQDQAATTQAASESTQTVELR